MKRPNPAWYVSPVWYVLAVGLVLAPVGLRVYLWPRPQTHHLDPAAVQAGKVLFTHEWKPNDPLAKGGDGLGPVFNATSCVACHRQGGLGGSAGVGHNVTTFVVSPTIPGQSTRVGVVHTGAMPKKFQENLSQAHPDLPATQPTLEMVLNRRGDLRLPTGVVLSQRNTPALFGARLIDEIPDRVMIAQERHERVRFGLAPTDAEDKPVGRALRLPGGKIGKFGWKAQAPSLLDFVEGACANELGLGNPGQAQPSPLSAPNYRPPGLDLTLEQCQQMTTFIASLPRPIEKAAPGAADKADEGRKLFLKIGCADCHIPNIGSIEGIYSDLLLHRMGRDLQGSSAYYGEPIIASTSADGPLPDEWRTPPLWGVADSAPYLHDGRAATLEEAIVMHGGQAAHAARRFGALSAAEQAQLIAFLKSLRAPPEPR